MSRRRGQDGNLEKHGDFWYVRFWIDVPGEHRRKRACVRVCADKGEGALNKSERTRRAREIIRESGADSPELFWKAYAANSGITFRQQAEWWLEHVKNRKRRPVKPATLTGWRSLLNRRLLPELGDMALADINNQGMKKLVATLAEAKLKPKSILNHVQVVKMVVASALRDDGEEMFPRKWNHDYIDLPLVHDQRRPAFGAETVMGILERSTGQNRVLFALLAGTGLRVGEALGLEIRHLDEECRTLRIEQSVWHGNVQLPKTPYAIRQVDLAPELAAVLKQFVGDRREGFLFVGRGEQPVSSQSDILRRTLHPILEKLNVEKSGFHAFRRFRITFLRKSGVPESLIQYWSGHSPQSVTDLYTKVGSDLQFRRDCAERTGLGFQIPPEKSVEDGSRIVVLDEMDESKEKEPVRN